MTTTKDPEVTAWEKRQAEKVREQRVLRETLEADRKAAALDQAMTSQERSTAHHALIVAAEKFEEDVKYLRDQKEVGTGFAGLIEQFERQAKDSRKLAERLEP